MIHANILVDTFRCMNENAKLVITRGNDKALCCHLVSGLSFSLNICIDGAGSIKACRLDDVTRIECDKKF